MIFRRGSGQRQSPVSLDLANRLRGLGLAVLDRLGFIQHQRSPFDAAQFGRMLLQQVVTGNQ